MSVQSFDVVDAPAFSPAGRIAQVLAERLPTVCEFLDIYHAPDGCVEPVSQPLAQPPFAQWPVVEAGSPREKKRVRLRGALQ